MTNEQAARILDPETSREALAPSAHDCQLRLAVTEEACTVAAKVLRQTAWISVKDRLPSEPDLVTGAYHSLIIVCGKDGDVGFTYWDCDLGMPNDDVAYWMPLPEPPKED